MGAANAKNWVLPREMEPLFRLPREGTTCVQRGSDLAIAAYRIYIRASLPKVLTVAAAATSQSPRCAMPLTPRIFSLLRSEAAA